MPKSDDLSWPETLHGVLSSPEKTFSYMIDNPSFFNDQKATQSFFLVFLIGLASGCAALSFDYPFLTFITLVSSICSQIMNWILLTFLLFGFAKFFKKEKVTMLASITLTAWAHAPLILIPTAYCFSGFSVVLSEILGALAVLWSLALLIIAFKVSLNTGYMKLVFVTFVAPPLLIVSCSFWSYFALSYMTLKIVSSMI